MERLQRAVKMDLAIVGFNMNKPTRSAAQLAADERYEAKRANNSMRFGGRCSKREKDSINSMLARSGIETEKELIMAALADFNKTLTEFGP